MGLTDWLTFFGITPQQLTPLAITLGAALLISWRYFWRDIKSEVTDLHNATKEIQSHLSGRTRTNRLNPIHPIDKLTWATSNSPFELGARGLELAQKSGISSIASLDE